MTLPVTSSMSIARIESFCRKASRLTLSQAVDDVVVEETLVTEDEGASRRRNFTVTMHLFPREQYEEEYETSPKEILNALGSAFALVLKKEIQVELKKLSNDLKNQLANVGKGHAAPREDRGGEDDDEDAEGGDEDEAGDAAPSKLPPRDDVSEVGDGDAEEEKRVRQTRQQSYDSDSEDEHEEGNEEHQSEKGDGVESQAADSDSEDSESTGEGDIRVTWADRVRLAGERLADICSFVSPGSFVFEHKSRSRCTFDLSVSHRPFLLPLSQQ